MPMSSMRLARVRRARSVATTISSRSWSVSSIVHSPASAQSAAVQTAGDRCTRGAGCTFTNSSGPALRAPTRSSKVSSRSSAWLDDSAEVVAVFEHRVDLPRAVGTVDPHLFLLGEATRAVLLDGLDTVAGQPRLVRGDLVGRHHFDAEVVEPALGSGVLEQHELQGRVVDREVRVAGLALVGCGCEQLRVVVDRGVDVGNVEGELDSWTREHLSGTLTTVDVSILANVSTPVNR